MTKSTPGCTIAAIMTILIALLMPGEGWGECTSYEFQGSMLTECRSSTEAPVEEWVWMPWVKQIKPKPEPSCAEQWEEYDKKLDPTVFYIPPDCRRPKAEKVCRWEWRHTTKFTSVPVDLWEPFAVNDGYVWLKREICTEGKAP